MDIVSLVIDQLLKYHGWRFYVPILSVACIAAAVHFTVGWTNLSICIVIFLVLLGTLLGILWQYLHERNS